MNAPLSLAASVQPGPTGPADPRDAFKSAMRHLAGGVTVVTVAYEGQLGGLAATAVTSLSVEPPSLLVCVKQNTSAMPLLLASGCFAVSILGHAHQPIADRFSGRDGSRGAERFRDAIWVETPGRPPVLADALASFECEVEEVIERFSHAIIIGRVSASRAIGGDGALVYWRAAYAKLAASGT